MRSRYAKISDFPRKPTLASNEKEEHSQHFSFLANANLGTSDFRRYPSGKISGFPENALQKTTVGRTQEPSRANVRMLEKFLSTKILLSPGGIRRKTPAGVFYVGGRQNSLSPHDLLMQQFPPHSIGRVVFQETWEIIVLLGFADLGDGIR